MIGFVIFYHLSSMESEAPRVACAACESLDASSKLGPEALAEALKARPLWTLSEDGTRVARHLVAVNFKAAFEFMTAVAEIAEDMKHHPDMSVYSFRNVKLEVYTHSVGVGSGAADSNR